MKLEKIYFYAYKSLINLEIELNKSCIGIVGINESGKSNILKAINTLDEHFPLTEGDTPKMIDTNPCISFIFTFTSEEKNFIDEKIRNWCEDNTIDFVPKFDPKLFVEYKIEFDREVGRETRYLKLLGIEKNDNFYFLKEEYRADDYKIFHNEELISLKNALIIPKKILVSESKNVESNSKLYEINQKIDELNDQIEEADEENETKSNDRTPVKLQIEALEKDKKKLEDKITFNICEIIADIESDIEILNKRKEEKEESLKSKEKELKPLEELGTLDTTQETEKTELQKSISKLRKEIEQIESELEDLENQEKAAKCSINEKYTQDLTEFEATITDLLEDDLTGEIPRVVFWENNDEYILKSSTKIETLLKATNLSSISRPLINLFRISLNVKTIKDFKDTLNKISKDGGYRSKAEAIMNSEVNKYIKNVWQDYSQMLKISLEEHQIRVEIYDPERAENADFYKMEERSQGFKTFISFILTVGAEAKKGVIKDTILLLDEPENHLHPTGVRFMLDELKNISKNNTVIYATHSSQMIDKGDYSSHLISKKIKDKTIITQAVKDRIGYFMQEEVLFDGLEIDLSANVASVHSYNFVFEGDGDAAIFRHYYEKILNANERPFQANQCQFFQGGKCSDIEKYFKNRPIQLGTKWIFILDKDAAAEHLIKFVEGKYKDYVRKDIFTFSYEKDGKNVKCELEDLLPKELIVESVKESVAASKILELSAEAINSFLTGQDSYGVYINQIKNQIEQVNIEAFISKFKEALNKNIKASYEKITDKKLFEETYPDYVSFLKTVITNLTLEKPKKPNKREVTVKATS